MALVKQSLVNAEGLAKSKYKISANIVVSAFEKNKNGQQHGSVEIEGQRVIVGEEYYFLPLNEIDFTADFEISIGFIDKYDGVEYDGLKMSNGVLSAKNASSQTWVNNIYFENGIEITSSLGLYPGKFNDWFFKNASSRIEPYQIITIKDVKGNIVFNELVKVIKPLRVGKNGLCDFEGNLIFAFTSGNSYLGLNEGDIIPRQDTVFWEQEKPHIKKKYKPVFYSYFSAIDEFKKTVKGVFSAEIRGNRFLYNNLTIRKTETYYYVSIHDDKNIFSVNISITPTDKNSSDKGSLADYFEIIDIDMSDYQERVTSIFSYLLPWLEDCEEINAFSVSIGNEFEQVLAEEEAYDNDFVLETANRITENDIIIRNNLRGNCVVKYGENEIVIDGNNDFSLNTQNKSLKNDIVVYAERGYEIIPFVKKQGSYGVLIGISSDYLMPELFEKIVGFNIFVDGIYYKTVLAQEIEE